RFRKLAEVCEAHSRNRSDRFTGFEVRIGCRRHRDWRFDGLETLAPRGPRTGPRQVNAIARRAADPLRGSEWDRGFSAEDAQKHSSDHKSAARVRRWGGRNEPGVWRNRHRPGFGSDTL